MFKGCSVSSCGGDIGESCVGCSVLMLLCVILVLCWLSELLGSVVVETLVSILLMYFEKIPIVQMVSCSIRMEYYMRVKEMQGV